jgi:hypothetical protein
MTPRRTPLATFGRSILASGLLVTALVARSMIVIGIAVVGLSNVALAQNTQRPVRPSPQQQRQIQAPRVGEERWSVDGTVLHRWTHGGWVPTGWRRQFYFSNSRLIYDMYYNNRAVRRMNESVPGWTQMLDLSGNPPYWRAWPTDNPNAIYMFAGNQNQWWLEADYVKYLQAILAQLQDAARRAPSAPVPARHPFIRPGEKLIAHNVRENIPQDNARRTPEERRFVEQSNAMVINGMIRTAQIGICENNRGGAAYDANGNVNSGYYDSMTGVRQRTC